MQITFDDILDLLTSFDFNFTKKTSQWKNRQKGEPFLNKLILYKKLVSQSHNIRAFLSAVEKVDPKTGIYDE